MEIFIKENLLIAKLMVSENFSKLNQKIYNLLILNLILVTGKKIKCMVLVVKFLKTAPFMKVSLRKESKKDMEFILGVMEVFTQAIGFPIK
jgi:NifU-like protein involved in Fe-S cluster formation